MKNYVVISLLLSALIVGLAFLIWKKHKRYDRAATPEPPEIAPDAINCDRYLSMGSSGTEVTVLQLWYNANRPGFSPQIAVDGVWGAITEAAIYDKTGKNKVQLKELTDSPC